MYANLLMSVFLTLYCLEYNEIHWKITENYLSECCTNSLLYVLKICYLGENIVNPLKIIRKYHSEISYFPTVSNRNIVSLRQ